MGFIAAEISMGKEISIEEQAQFEKLRLAIVSGDEAMVKAALAERFKVNSKNGFGETLLMIAAEAGKKNIVELLIATKAKLDTRDQFNFHDGGGQTALHRAVANRHAEIVQVLLSSGAKVDVADKSARTALELAVENNDLAIAELLLKAGANPNGSGRTTTPLSSAVVLKFEKVVEMLLKYEADPNHPADAHSTVLGSAAVIGAVESCRLLIEAGAIVHARNSDGQTALEGINNPRCLYMLGNSPLSNEEKLKQAVEARATIKAMLTEAAKREESSLSAGAKT